jgi:PAS domain S-box-containing protein
MAKNIRILILEDMEDDVLLLLRALKKGGYDPEYEVVDNSGDFINSMKSREWDLIISDYSMPGYNGIQALRTYKAMDIDIPFILVSGTIGEEVAVEAMREGAHDYLMKGSLQRLVPAIERELREARIRRQSREDSIALKKSEEKFAKAFRTSTDAIAIAKACNGEFVDINDGFTRIFGYSREETIGKTSRELNIWQSDMERDAFVTPLIENGVTRDREVQFGSRSGTVITALISGEFLDIGGEQCILTFTKDITERRKAAKALEESESRLRNIIENANQIIFTIDKTGKVTFISPAWKRLMGYEEKDILGKVFLEFVHPHDLQIASSALETVIRTKHLIDPVVIRVKHRTGDWRWLRVSGSYLENLDPDVPQYGGIAEDITEAKLSADKLRESNLRLNTLLEAIPDMVYLKDVNGTLLEVNRAYEEITGLPRDRILGTGGEDFLPEKILKMNRETDQEVLRSGTMVQFNDLYRSGEHEMYVSVRKVPLKDEDGTVTGIVGVTSDITDIRKSEQKYRSALEGAIQTMSRIVELRDPYTAGHQNRASRLAVEIGRSMGFSQERLEGVRVASLLYEIGKINVPSEILNKPGKISSMEYELIQGHPESAWDILKNIDFPWPVAEIVHQHHERMDGSGYPSGLKGEDILLEARILAVADVVEAMCSHRPYRPSLGIDKALEEIERGSGIIYDSQVADLCVELFREKGFVME